MTKAHENYGQRAKILNEQLRELKVDDVVRYPAKGKSLVNQQMSDLRSFGYNGVFYEFRGFVDLEAEEMIVVRVR